ncbi:MAG TPA: phosphatidate cytidylyltransferase [Pseudomonadales bacterium]|nr:phosphatidate cytidylyltransferase [Pseudomonadales bacterium]
MLKSRVITACVLIAILFSILFLMPYQGFVVADLVVFTLAAWEWSNLAGSLPLWQRVVYAVFFPIVLFPLSGLVGAASVWFLPVLFLVVLGWGIALLMLWRYPDHVGWYRTDLMLGIGVWLLLPAAVGLLVLHRMASGSSLILLLVAVIAVSDIGAYFCGRRFGRHKLAVRISPGKTWEGFWGGICSSLVLAVLVGFFSRIPSLDFFLFCIVLVGTAAVSVVGDLFESMVKRERGVKDSGQLLPGHGGVLDRIDGWTAAVPFFTLCYLVTGRLL